MNPWRFVIGAILFVYVNGFYPAIPAFALVPEVNKDIKLPRDSLNHLDSLVYNNRVSNNPLAIQYAKKALAIARLMNSDEALVIAYKSIGIAYLLDQKDSSYFYFNMALKLAEKGHFLNWKIHILYNLALLNKASYNYEAAIKLLDSLIRLAETVQNYQVISNAYNTLGNVNIDIHKYAEARRMYDSALSIASKHSLYKQMGVAISNLARFQENTRKSISLQKEALNYLEKEKGTEEEMANIFINMGNRFKNPDSALFYYKSALNLALTANLPILLFGACNNMAYSYLDKKDIQMAESCLKDKAIPEAIKLQDNDWLSSLYDTYADVCVAQGDYKKALEMQKKSLKSRIADNQQKASEQVRLLAAQLDLKNKELIIQNEEKKLIIQQNRLERTEFWLTISVLLVIASIFVIFGLRQLNRVRLHKAQNESARKLIEMEESEKGRTARELHDLTGQLVLGISGTIENIDFPEQEIKDQIRDKINDLGSSIRRISHRMNRAMIEHFTFSELINGMVNDVKKLSGMSVQLEIPEVFPDLPNELVLHFYRITQELLTNASKYARDSVIKIRIITENDKLALYYSDDGPGFFPEEKKKSSMGLMNIFERVKLINGKAFVKSAPGKGTSWEIFFPIDRKHVVKS
jgi:two-component system, NarL family, sensor kinase